MPLVRRPTGLDSTGLRLPSYKVITEDSDATISRTNQTQQFR